MLTTPAMFTIPGYRAGGRGKVEWDALCDCCKLGVLMAEDEAGGWHRRLRWPALCSECTPVVDRICSDPALDALDDEYIKVRVPLLRWRRRVRGVRQY